MVSVLGNNHVLIYCDSIDALRIACSPVFSLENKTHQHRLSKHFSYALLDSLYTLCSQTNKTKESIPLSIIMFMLEAPENYESKRV